MGKSKLVVNILLPHHLAILKLFPYVSLVFQVFFGSCYCCFFFFPPFLPKFNYQVLSAQKKQIILKVAMRPTGNNRAFTLLAPSNKYYTRSLEVE